MPKRAAYLFLLLAIGHLLSELFANSVAIYVTKPLLLLSLAYIFFQNTNLQRNRSFARWLMAGLLFSCGGDILLMFTDGGTGTFFFISGLSSFLLAHLCYVLAFWQYQPRGIQMDWVTVLFFYILASSLVIYLWPVLDSILKVAISIYALAISTMGIFAFGMYRKLSFKAASFLLFGALCFIFSDSMIALNKFRPEINIWMPRITIMSSYILAQFLIVSGAILAQKQQTIRLDSSRITSSPDR